MSEHHRSTDLYYSAQMALGCQLEALLLGPDLDATEPVVQPSSPLTGAQLAIPYQPIKQPNVDEVKHLREKLDCQSSVDICCQEHLND